MGLGGGQQQAAWLAAVEGKMILFYSELEENSPPFPNSALFLGPLHISPEILLLNHQHSADGNAEKPSTLKMFVQRSVIALIS